MARKTTLMATSALMRAMVATTAAAETVAFLMPDQASTRYEEHDWPGFQAAMGDLCPDCTLIYQNGDAEVTMQLINGAPPRGHDNALRYALAAVRARRGDAGEHQEPDLRRRHPVRRRGVHGGIRRCLRRAGNRVGSADLARRHPCRAAPRIPSVREPIASLSGGQRQTVAIARSLFLDPHIIMLDEPTAALGVGQTAEVLNLIERVRDRGTASS